VFNSYRTDVQTALNGISSEKVQEAVELLRRARFQNANVYIVGNGGSAATASHFANDLLKMCSIRAFSLPDMVPVMTAFGNDHGWEYAFENILSRVLLAQDVVIAISCSGNSPNVIEAIRLMKNINLPGLKTIALTGANYDCALSKLVPDVMIYVPFKDIRVQEDCHMIICHAIAGALSNADPGKV